MYNKKWEFFEKDMIRQEWKGRADGFVIDWTDENGLSLFVFYKRPTSNEIDDFESNKSFKIAFKDVDGIGFFAFKFGNQNWAYCVFSPNIYDNKPEFEETEKGKTYALNIFLVDTEEGKLKVLRTIALGRKFSEYFRKWCIESLKKDIDKNYYNNTIDEAFKTYGSPDEIANSADIFWELPQPEEKIRTGREERERQREIE